MIDIEGIGLFVMADVKLPLLRGGANDDSLQTHSRNFIQHAATE